jgi:nucleoside-diphosphate-sugar epimerase
VKALVTGATGFVGQALVRQMVADGRFAVRAAVRRETGVLPAGVECVVTGDLSDLNGEVTWQAALSGVDAVVHLAARVHVMRESASDPLTEFRRVNVAPSLELARRAAEAGVRRFVYLSSVKVNGESGTYTESDAPAPEDAYGVSKHEAEVGLRRIADETGLEVVIIRPPLVYGPGVRANFRALMHAVARGIPLPLGAIDNRRSLVASDNLADFILTCVNHSSARNQTFLVSDGEDLSTTNLIRRLAGAMGRPARLLPVPASLLMMAATLAGQRDAAKRLIGSLQVDISRARRLLNWTPPISVDEGLRRAVAAL